MKNCRITNTGKIRGTSPQYGIDCEPWQQNECVRDISIHDNYFANNNHGDVMLAGIGDNHNNWGYGFNIYNNSRINIYLKGVSNVYVNNQPIETGQMLFCDSVKFEECDINYGFTIMGHKSRRKVEFVFDNCVFTRNSEAISDSKSFFHARNFNYKWDGTFRNCLFNVNVPNFSVTANTLGSKERFVNCVFNAKDFETSIGGFLEIVGCKFNTRVLNLMLGVVDEDYKLMNNHFFSASTSPVVNLLNMPDLTENYRNSIIITNNTIDSVGAFFITSTSKTREKLSFLKGKVANNGSSLIVRDSVVKSILPNVTLQE